MATGTCPNCGGTVRDKVTVHAQERAVADDGELQDSIARSVKVATVEPGGNVGACEKCGMAVELTQKAQAEIEKVRSGKAPGAGGVAPWHPEHAQPVPAPDLEPDAYPLEPTPTPGPAEAPPGGGE